MSTQTFTPGPWTHRQMNHHFAVEAANGVRVCEVRFVRRPDGSTSEDEAALIAAAPELYEALSFARKYITLRTDRGEHFPEQLTSAIDAALAKVAHP